MQWAPIAPARRRRDDVGLHMLKFGIFGGLYGALFATVGDVAAGIVLFAAAAGALGWGWKRIVTPLVNLSAVLERLPAWMKHTDDELAEIKSGAQQAADRAEEAMNIAHAVKRQVGATARGEHES